jgi:hypothetical protein
MPPIGVFTGDPDMKKYIVVEHDPDSEAGTNPYRVVKTKNLLEPLPGEMLSKGDVQAYVNSVGVDVHVQPLKKGGK